MANISDKASGKRKQVDEVVPASGSSKKAKSSSRYLIYHKKKKNDAQHSPYYSDAPVDTNVNYDTDNSEENNGKQLTCRVKSLTNSSNALIIDLDEKDDDEEENEEDTSDGKQTIEQQYRAKWWVVIVGFDFYTDEAQAPAKEEKANKGKNKAESSTRVAGAEDDDASDVSGK
jgi:hypothetical protein